MPQLSGDLIRHKLPTFTFGQSVIYTEQTGSTNTELKQLARWGAPEGTLYITDEQLVGRGRLNKSWHAPAQSSLLMSLLFRPGDFLAPHQAQRLTMLCALALTDAIEMVTELSPPLKWPNDLMWKDGKKLAGVLTELGIEGDKLTWVVVGVGLNVNVNFAKHEVYQAGNGAPPISQTATSLSIILDRDTADLRLPILQKYLFHVERRYNALREGQLPQQEWRDRLLGLGETVTIIDGDGGKQEGIMRDVDENGALILQRNDGKTVSILAGDVSLRR
ncbi:MAG: biotin--[acetyl-CoA-carboxylase] ligase [Anaerolineae bacterium]|nr:biotin--[acetyl-CoA-carboxylase] ligase [Anaerolineae bacterium]